MSLINYIEIENFKTFEKKIRVDLTHPAVLIGPNNSGKTSVLQALALWSRGVRAWHERKGKRPRKEALKNLSAGINRKNLLEIPVLQSRSLWNGSRVRIGNNPVKMDISVGLSLEGIVKECSLSFTQRDNEVIYCRPSPTTIDQLELIEKAAAININLLYPMSGIETEEPLLQEGRINVLMGQGQTAQVLRNLCYSVWQSNPLDWDKIVNLMDRQFNVELSKPEFNTALGTIGLTYIRKGDDKELDINTCGRGMLQALLILSYLYGHKNSILMIDEPDAHLEILRQKQIYHILSDTAAENDCQVIIATHSEVVLEEAADTCLNLILEGEAVDIASVKEIKESLKTFGIEHYYKSKINRRVLYLEGSSDLSMLKALATRLRHPVLDLLNDRLYCYYTRSIFGEKSLDNQLDHDSGLYLDFHRHYNAMKRFIPSFKGIALLDSDGKFHQNEISKDLAVIYWNLCELENYFITPPLLRRYLESQKWPIFFNSQIIGGIIDNLLISQVFNGDRELLKQMSGQTISLWRQVLSNKKMSDFTEQVFEQLAEQTEFQVILRKGQYYQMIELLTADEIPSEINEKLDRLMEYLTPD